MLPEREDEASGYQQRGSSRLPAFGAVFPAVASGALLCGERDADFVVTGAAR
jgi:hypothetical protein